MADPEFITRSWPTAGWSGYGNWPCPSLKGITVVRTISYKKIRTVYPEDESPGPWSGCYGKDPVVEYQEYSSVETLSANDLDIFLGGAFFGAGAAKFPCHAIYYPSIYNYSVYASGPVSDPWTSSWRSAECVWDDALGDWKFQLGAVQNASGDNHLATDMDGISLSVFRRWFHGGWGFRFGHERLSDDDNNFGVEGYSRAWLGNGTTKTFALTPPPPPSAYPDWQWEYYNESITITIDAS